MRLIPRKWWLVLLLSAFVCVPKSAATIIEYEVFDLPDPVPGQDRWEYRYYVSGLTVFEPNPGFSIWFDRARFEQLELPSPPNSDWDVIVLQPDLALPADGIFDALALVQSASLNQPFEVRFALLSGTPGSQPFHINQFDSQGNFVAILESGNTIPRVPEPGTVWLLLAGTGCVLLLRRSRFRG
jgi:hypothetical protein